MLLYGTSLQGSQMDSIEIAAEFLFVFVVFQGGVLVHGNFVHESTKQFWEHSEHVIGRRVPITWIWFEVILCGFYHGKSPLNHHLGESVFFTTTEQANHIIFGEVNIYPQKP